MSDKLFREKSLKKISSPEELDEYIKVSNPGVWLILSAVIILLISLCVWGVFGKLETVVNAVGTVENGNMTAVLSAENSDKVEPGMAVYLNGKAVGIVETLAENNSTAELDITNLADGKYELDIIVESINPMYFILN